LIEGKLIDVRKVENVRLAVACQAIIKLNDASLFIFILLLLGMKRGNCYQQKEGNEYEKERFHVFEFVKNEPNQIKVGTISLLLQLSWHYYCRLMTLI
jgi:hypothetical protein